MEVLNRPTGNNSMKRPLIPTSLNWLVCQSLVDSTIVIEAIYWTWISTNTEDLVRAITRTTGSMSPESNMKIARHWWNYWNRWNRKSRRL